MNPQDYIAKGVTGTRTETVEESMTVGALVPGMPYVYSTPYMITVMEVVAEQSVAALLPDGWVSVGVHVDVKHLKATPLGFNVTTTSEVVEVTDKTIRFRVEAHDDIEMVGQGFHVRGFVERSRFDAGMERKTLAKPARRNDLGSSSLGRRV